MSGQHKNPTISFHISDYERREIEARIKASGMMKKDYFTRSCIYNRICVVGKKEVIYELVECVRNMQEDMHLLAEEVYKNGRIKGKKSPIDGSEYTNEEANLPAGKYGDLWMQYMKENHPERYRNLVRFGRLRRTAAEVNEEAYELLEGIEECCLKKHKNGNGNSFMKTYRLRMQLRMMAEETVMEQAVRRYH